MITLLKLKKIKRRCSMDKNEMQQILEDTKVVLRDNPTVIHYLYTGQIYSEEDVLCRLDTMYGYLIYNLQQESFIQRTYAVKGMNDKGEPSITLSWKPVFKISNGRRKGRYTDAEHIHNTENVVCINSPRPLKLDDNIEEGLCPSSALDRALIVHLKDLTSSKVEYTHKPFHPFLWSSTNKNNDEVFIRNESVALNYLKQLPGYNNKTTDAQNTVALKSKLGTNAGNDRVAYPFEFFYGKGVMAVSMDSFGLWFKTPKSSFPLQQSYVTVDYVVDERCI
jgi:hypothetical protein